MGVGSRPYRPGSVPDHGHCPQDRSRRSGGDPRAPLSSAYLATLDHPESKGTGDGPTAPLTASWWPRSAGTLTLTTLTGRGLALPLGSAGQMLSQLHGTLRRGAVGSLLGYCQEQGWIPDAKGLMAGIQADRGRQPPTVPARLPARRLTPCLRARIYRYGIRPCSRCFTRLAHGRLRSLALTSKYIDRPNKRARVTRKGGAQDWIVWQTGTATLLPRLLKGRTTGPLFVTDRKARVQLPPSDLDEHGRARLSYRQAEDLFKEASGGATLHQLRHSAHYARCLRPVEEHGGANGPKSGHSSGQEPRKVREGFAGSASAQDGGYRPWQAPLRRPKLRVNISLPTLTSAFKRC